MSSNQSGDFVSYFDYQQYPPAVPDLQDGHERKRHAVVIVGGGPIGLALALDLARFGVPSVVLEADDTVCQGSRAGCVTRRTLDIFEQLGISEPTLRQGLPWHEGWSYNGTNEVYRMQVPDDPLSKFPTLVNIQQCYVEQYMVERIEALDELIDLRWQSRVAGIENQPDGVTVTVGTPNGDYTLDADWLVACDGARSFVRSALDLRYVGTQFEDGYIIVDILMKSEMGPGRRAWFNPPSNPGATLLLHKHRNDLWRFDYQLREDEDPDEAAKPENVFARIQDHLDLIGETAPWSPVWISAYNAKCMSLESYRHGRVLFAGDAAHLVPIFGVRGMNSGIEDIDNLAWKLALVQQGVADDRLIDTYSDERHEAMLENMRQSSKSAEFMAPPSKAFKTMRDAVLALSERHDWIAQLVDWRTSSPVGYPSSQLNHGGPGAPNVPAPGTYLRDVELAVSEDGDLKRRHLSDLRGPYFTLLSFNAAPPLGRLATLLDDHLLRAIAVDADPTITTAEWFICQDLGQNAATALEVETQPILLIRPDGFLLAGFGSFDETEILTAMENCRQGGQKS